MTRNRLTDTVPPSLTVPTSGYVYDSSAADKRRKVNGFAFETPGREWLHMWVTPSIERYAIFDGWHVSHWETGARITDHEYESPVEAIHAAQEYMKRKTDEQIREALDKWYAGESWPGK